MEPTLIYTFSIFASIILIFVTGVFLLSRIKHDNSVMDSAYGLSFIVGTWGTIVATQSFSLTALLAGTLVSLWGLRLSARIIKKNWGRPEDPRYGAWRTAWMEHGQLYFVLRSYIQVNLLQGIVITLVSSPLILLIAAGSSALPSLSYVGIAIFLLGLMYESIADMQLDAFIGRKKAGTEPANLMQTGLFYYSRRPNYFGEATIWCGLAVMALPFAFGWVALISPFIITYVVAKITGPMLENMFLEKYPEEYRAYMESTSYLIPLPKRRVS